MSPPDQPRVGEPHVDDDTLALVALGEPTEPWVTTHLDSCGQCRLEVDSFARVVLAGRSMESADQVLQMPPASVWERITADLGMSSGVDDARDAEVLHLPDRTSAARQEPTPTRNRSRLGLLVAASVVGALIGIGVTLGWQALDDPEVVATAPLEPLPSKVGNGEATLVGTGDERELNLSLDVDAPSDAYLQVWLMTPDASKMVPVGVLEDGKGFWRVPAGLDLDAYPLVDVSIEPFDGNSAHSGDSIVRGSLSSA